MNEKFFPELSRRLRQEGIITGQVDGNYLPVLMNGQGALLVDSSGITLRYAQMADDSECVKLYGQVAGISAQVYEYTAAVAAAPQLVAEGLHENFRLLSEFNGVVLAGREMEGGLGYEFSTWRRTENRTRLTQGNYYSNYDGVKLDFACRAGLVEKNRQFTDEQLVEVYRCIHETLDGEYSIARERYDMLTAAASQIERSVDDLDERVNLSNRQELEAAEQRNDSPGLEMTS